ncbi:MAG: hypothetical protein JSS89_08520 [Bacteroidetes bacterium]|nr:hypothetical protein [Bacteroidota bacterium]
MLAMALLICIAGVIGGSCVSAQTFTKLVAVNYSDLNARYNAAYARLASSFDDRCLANVVGGTAVVRLRVDTPPLQDTIALTDSMRTPAVLCMLGQKVVCTYVSMNDNERRLAIIDDVGSKITTVSLPKEALALPDTNVRISSVTARHFPESPLIFLVVQFEPSNISRPRICVLDTLAYSLRYRYDDALTATIAFAANGKGVRFLRDRRDSAGGRYVMATLDLRTGAVVREDPADMCYRSPTIIDLGLPSTYASTSFLVQRHGCSDSMFTSSRKALGCLAAPNVLLTSRRISSTKHVLEAYDLLTHSTYLIDQFSCLNIDAIVDPLRSEIHVTTERPDERVIYSYRGISGREGIAVFTDPDTSLVFEPSSCSAYFLGTQDKVNVRMTSTGMDWDPRDVQPYAGYVQGTLQNTMLGRFPISFVAIDALGDTTSRSEQLDHVVRYPGKHTFVTNTLPNGRLSINSMEGRLLTSAEDRVCSVPLAAAIVADTAHRSCVVIKNTSVSIQGSASDTERVVARVVPGSDGTSVRLNLVRVDGDTSTVDSASTTLITAQRIRAVSAIVDSVIGYQAYNSDYGRSWVRLLQQRNGTWHVIYDSILTMLGHVEDAVPGRLTICSEGGMISIDLRSMNISMVPIAPAGGYVVNDSLVVTGLQVWKKTTSGWTSMMAFDGGRTYAPIYISPRFSAVLSRTGSDVGFVVDHQSGEIVERLGPGYANVSEGVYSARLHGLFLTSAVMSFVPISTPIDGVMSVADRQSTDPLSTALIVSGDRPSLIRPRHMRACNVYTLQGAQVATIQTDDDISSTVPLPFSLPPGPYVALWTGVHGEMLRMLFILAN